MSKLENPQTDVRRAKSAHHLPVIRYNDGTTSIMNEPATPDALDCLLTRVDMAHDPLLLTDPKTGLPLQLTPQEAALIERMEAGMTGDVDFDPFQPYVDFFTQHRLDGPLQRKTEPKGRFAVSKWESERVKKLVFAIRKGYIKPAVDDTLQHYDVWGMVDPEAEARACKRVHLPAPKPALPGHELSYNPPEEYLPTPSEVAEWEALPEEERNLRPLPKKFKSLRLVPLYNRLVHERFARCLDLYLCPRVVKQKIDIADPDSLLPELPNPEDLKPYPTMRSTEFLGHESSIIAIDIHMTGQWLSSCTETEVRVWDTVTGRCIAVYTFEKVQSVSWCPRSDVAILSIALDKTLLLMSPEACGLQDQSCALFMGAGAGTAASMLKWRQQDNTVVIEHDQRIDQVCWHHRGDYVACLCKHAPTLAASIVMHQLSRRTSQQPFGKLPAGSPRSIAFAHQRTYLLLATAQHVRVYDLMSQRLVKKLTPSVNNILHVTSHPRSADNILTAVGEKLSWFDCDLSPSPYKTLHTHTHNITAISIHRQHPLFATVSDDGTVQAFHGKVYDELDRTALIVPVRVMRELEGRQVKAAVFHPHQAWLYTGDSSGAISVFV